MGISDFFSPFCQQREAIGLYELLCSLSLAEFYLRDLKIFVTKYKQTACKTIFHSSEMETAPKGHTRNRFNCSRIACKYIY